MNGGGRHTSTDIIKPLRWLGASYRDLVALPAEAQHEAGFELFAVQQGRQPSDSKPMPAVGPGVYEIRVHSRREHRIFYVAKFREAVYVLHAFEKRTQKTAERDLHAGRRAFADMITLRRQEGRT